MEFTSVAIVAVRKVGVDLLRFVFDPETAEEELSFCFGGMRRIGGGVTVSVTVSVTVECQCD